MSDPFLAEIKIVGFYFAPRGWAFCDGQILPINQHQSLYSLLETTYGGDGRTSFALPDLRGRTPIHKGLNHAYGEKGGEEKHILSIDEIAVHSHDVRINNTDGQATIPEGSPALSRSKYETRYSNDEPLAKMAANIIGNSGVGQGHENMQPSLVVNFCIALYGLYPSIG